MLWHRLIGFSLEIIKRVTACKRIWEKELLGRENNERKRIKHNCPGHVIKTFLRRKFFNIALFVRNTILIIVAAL